jgi:hypothetical protein
MALANTAIGPLVTALVIKSSSPQIILEVAAARAFATGARMAATTTVEA